MKKEHTNIFYQIILYIIIIVNILFISACSIDRDYFASADADTLTLAQTDEMRKIEAIKKHDIFPLIKYNQSAIRDWKHRGELFNEYKMKDGNWSKNKTFRTLHREEVRYLRPGEKLVIPDTFITDQRAYSVFPPFYWEARDIPKILIVSNAYQAYACYEYGKLVRFAATNTGKERTQTYPGRYSLVWKEKEHLSSLDSNWKMPYNFNFHANAGSAFHQFSMPGRPVSHSCCRQFLEDAKWLFYWGEGYKRDEKRRRIPLSGTPVIIIGIFDFSRKRGGPWLDVKSNKDVWLELPKDPMNIEPALIPISQIPENSRWGLPGGLKRYVNAEATLRAKGIIRPHVNLIVTHNYNESRRKKAEIEAEKKKLEEEKKQAELEKKEKSTANPDMEQIIKNINDKSNSESKLLKEIKNIEEKPEKEEAKESPPD